MMVVTELLLHGSCRPPCALRGQLLGQKGRILMHHHLLLIVENRCTSIIKLILILVGNVRL